MHILCSIPTHHLETASSIRNLLPGGIDIIGVARGQDMKQLSRQKIIEHLAVAVSYALVELGARTSFFLYSKGDIRITEASSARIEFRHHVIKLPVRVSVNPDNLAHQITEWFQESVKFSDGKQADVDVQGIPVIEHRAPVKVCNWTRRFCGPNPLTVQANVVLVGITKPQQGDIFEMLSESLRRQSPHLNNSIALFPLRPYHGLCILCPGVPKEHQETLSLGLLENGKRERFADRKVILIFAILAVLIPWLFTSIT